MADKRGKTDEAEPSPAATDPAEPPPNPDATEGYSPEEEEEVQKRLEDLGYI